jgi:hypothetical protein
MTRYEFGVSVFWDVDYDGLRKDSLNVTSGFIINELRFCCFVLEDVHNYEYMISGF